MATEAMTKAEIQDTALTEYRRKVRRTAIRFAFENDYCVETVNDFLRRVDLEPFNEPSGRFYGAAQVTGYYRQDAPVLTEDEALARVQGFSSDYDVKIDKARPHEVVEVHDDRVIMRVPIMVGGTSLGATATKWALDSLDLLSSERHRAIGHLDPLFDRSTCTKIDWTEEPEADPDADCWDGEGGEDA
jgi:hypothetical protein